MIVLPLYYCTMHHIQMLDRFTDEYYIHPHMITSDHQSMWGSLSLARTSSRGETVSGKCIVHCSHFVLWACSTQLAIPVHLLAGTIITEGHIIMDTSWKGLVRHRNDTFQVYVSLPGILYTNEAGNYEKQVTRGCIYTPSLYYLSLQHEKIPKRLYFPTVSHTHFALRDPDAAIFTHISVLHLYLFPELVMYGHCIRQIVACCIAESKAPLVP